MSQMSAHTIIVTIGPWHEKPWWWEQLARSPLRAGLIYDRISLGSRTHRQLGLAQLPALIMRLAGIVRRARREKIANVVTFESDSSCYIIGLLQLLPGFGGPRHTIVQFISGEKTASFKSGLKDFIAKICLRSVHRTICSSRAEAAYYTERFGWPAGKAVFVPLQTDERFINHPPCPCGDYIIAAGRSYRDYETLAQAVVGTGIRTIIVCGGSGPGIRTQCSEIEIVTEIPLAQLTNLIAGARAVVLPLEHRRISTGQSVLLQAMALGRPVITTRTAGTEDYIRDGETGLLVPPQDPPALRAAIKRIWNDVMATESMALCAKSEMVRSHLPVHYLHLIARQLNCSPTDLDPPAKP